MATQSDHEIQNSSNTSLLQKLASAVDGHAATATFACGGSVPILDLSTGKFGPDAQNLAPPITIRWDPRNTYTTQSKIAFPLPEHDKVSREMFHKLLHHCDPATFGVGGRDILDEAYRKAAKLDASDFSTSFHPHDCGILDSIQQILLPSTIRGGQGIGIGPQGVRAQLYKLNIYSAPSGKFLSHVDTPRGVMQFGSLVVCLPYQHEGGVLRVKHRGEVVDFTWGDTSQQSLQWAAFYGDCEHEVLQVTKGHRITLTYNLYYASIGKLAQPVSDPHRLPLFDIAHEMLLQPQFMRKGGILGFFCHHQYAHAQESGRKSIPGAFKGVDLAVFSVFHALGLKVGIHPIIENRSNEMGGLSAQELMRGPTVPREGDFVENCLANLSRRASQNPNDSVHDSDMEDFDQNSERKDHSTIVGTKFHPTTFTTFDDWYEEESEEPVTSRWPHKKVPQIIWMNDRMHKDFAYAGLKYGNEASLNHQFSSAAILVVVPPREKRSTVAPAPPPQQIPVIPVTTSPSADINMPIYTSSATLEPSTSYPDTVSGTGTWGSAWTAHEQWEPYDAGRWDEGGL